MQHENLKNTIKEKPKYGWYVGKILTIIGLIGGLGLTLFIFGFFIEYPINFIFWIVGIIICIIFLWPALGMLIMNLWIPRQDPKYDFLKNFKAPKILDCGCGTGRHAIKTAKHLPDGAFLIGIDIYNSVAISGSSLQRVQKNAELEGVSGITDFQKGSITDIPFDDQSFDIVSVQSVMHEIEGDTDKRKAYKEIYRVLKDDGLLRFGEWNRNSVNLILFTGIFAFVFKPKNFWEKQLKEQGFKIIKTQNHSGFIDFSAKKNL